MMSLEIVGESFVHALSGFDEEAAVCGGESGVETRFIVVWAPPIGMRCFCWMFLGAMEECFGLVKEGFRGIVLLGGGVVEKRAAFPVVGQPPRRAGMVFCLSPGFLGGCDVCNGGEVSVGAIFEKRAAFSVARQPPRRAGIVGWLSPGILDECTACNGSERSVEAILAKKGSISSSRATPP